MYSYEYEYAHRHDPDGQCSCDGCGRQGCIDCLEMRQVDVDYELCGQCADSAESEVA